MPDGLRRRLAVLANLLRSRQPRLERLRQLAAHDLPEHPLHDLAVPRRLEIRRAPTLESARDRAVREPPNRALELRPRLVRLLGEPAPLLKRARDGAVAQPRHGSFHLAPQLDRLLDELAPPVEARVQRAEQDAVQNLPDHLLLPLRVLDELRPVRKRLHHGFLRKPEERDVQLLLHLDRLSGELLPPREPRPERAVLHESHGFPDPLAVLLRLQDALGPRL